MKSYGRIFRTVLAFILILASILPYSTMAFATSMNTDEADLLMAETEEAELDFTSVEEEIDEEESEEADPEEEQLEILANQTLYGEDATKNLGEEKTETKAKNYTDYIFLNFKIGDKSRNFGWQVLSTTSYDYGLGGTDADNRGYFANNIQGLHAAYYKGNDPGLFMPIEDTDRARKRLGGYTVKSGDIAQVGIYTMNANAGDRIVEEGTETFRSYFTLWSSATSNQYASGKTTSTLKRTTGRQIAQFAIHDNHVGAQVYGVRWDPIQPNTDNADTSDDVGFTSSNGVLIYTDFIYVGPKEYKPLRIEYTNASGKQLAESSIGYVGHSQKAFFWNHGKTTSTNATNNTQTIWGWALYKKNSAGTWENARTFIIDATTYTVTEDVQFRLTEVTVPILPIGSVQEARPKSDEGKKAANDEDKDKYVISVDAIESAQITPEKFGTPVDFAILMDRSGSMDDIVSGRSFTDSGTNSTVGTIEDYLNTLDKTKWEGFYRVSCWAQNKSSDSTLPASQQKAEYFSYTMPLRYNRSKTAGSNKSGNVGNWEVLYLDDDCGCNSTTGKYSQSTVMSRYGIYPWLTTTCSYCTHVKWMSVTDAFTLYKKYRNNTNTTLGTNFKTYFKIGISRMGRQQEAVETLLQKIYASNDNLAKNVYHTVSIVGYGHTVFLKGYPCFDGDGDKTVASNYYDLTRKFDCTYKSKECNSANYEYMLEAVRDSYVYGQTCMDGAIRLLANKRSYPEQYADKSGPTQTATDYLPAATTGRDRVVILVTDGTPTMGTNSNFNSSAANSCVDGAKALKDAKVTIYTISLDDKVKELHTEETTAKKAASYNKSYPRSVDGSEDANKPWLANNLLWLVSSAYPGATAFPNANSDAENAKTGKQVTNKTYTFYDKSEASGIATAMNSIWSDKAPTLSVTKMSGSASLWLYEEFTREWKPDTSADATMNIYAQPYLGSGAYGTKILVGSHKVSSATSSQKYEGDGYTMYVDPTSDKGFSVTLQWLDTKQAFLRETKLETTYDVTALEQADNLDVTRGYKISMEIPVEVNRENTVGGNNIPLTTSASGLFKANSSADTAKGDVIHGYTQPNANVDCSIDADAYDYFMSMEEYVQIQNSGNASALMQGLYEDLVLFPDSSESPDMIQLVNSEGKTRLGYVSVEYSISTEADKVLYKKTAAQKGTSYTVVTDLRASEKSALKTDTTFKAVAALRNATHDVDSFGRKPYDDAVVELTPAVYVPKFAVVDFDGEVSVNLQKEGELVKAGTTGANGSFTAKASRYNFRADYDSATSAQRILQGWDTIPYTVTAKNPTKDGETEISREVYIIPGNVISYDDTLFTYGKVATEAKWSPVGTYTLGTQTAKSEEAHGYDANFATGGDFHGASMMTRVASTAPVANLASFEFFGTGFELLSRSAPDSGTMIVEIYKAKADGSYGAVADTGYLVDTYLSTGTLYQVPVVQYLSGNATPAKYKVNIIAFYDVAFDHSLRKRSVLTEEEARKLLGYGEDFDFHYITFDHGEASKRNTTATKAYNLYLDGCRVFNSVSDDTAGIRDYVYSLAKEKDANIFNINTCIIDVDSKVDWSKSGTATGALYIAATGKNTGSDGTVNTTANGFCLGMDGAINVKQDGDKYYVLNEKGANITHDEYKTAIYYKARPSGRVHFYCTNGSKEVLLTDAEVRLYVGDGERVTYYSAAYRAIGPANEVYLAKDQGVAFTVSAGSDKIFLGLKTVGSVSMQIWNGSTFVDFAPVQDFSSDATMYFNISDYGPDIILKNKGDGILSLVNVKCASVSGTVDPITVSGRLLAKASKAFETDLDQPVVDEELKIYHSLNLQSDISVNLVVPASALSDYDRYVMECTVAGETMILKPEVKGELVYFTVEGLSAVDMTENIRSVLYLTKGEETFTSLVDDYSIAYYAYTTMNKDNADQAIKTLCADLLRYGSMAQIYKNHNVDALADEEMTDLHKSYLTDLDSVTFGNTNRISEDLEAPTASWVGKTMILDSKVTLMFIADLSTYTGDLADLSLRATYTDIDGETVEVEISDFEAYSAEKGYYAFKLDTLLAAELRTPVSAAIYEGETRISQTLLYSADSYGNGKTGALLDLCKALLAYSDSAKAFFE